MPNQKNQALANFQFSSQPPLSQYAPEALLRLPQIIGNPKADPPVPPIIPVSKTTWWDGVKSGRFPKPVKLGPRVSAWRVEDIRALIENGAG